MSRNELKEFLSDSDVMHESWKAIVDAVIAKGGADKDLHKIQTDKSLTNAIADLIVGAKKIVGFPVIYDQSIGLMELIKRALGPDNAGNINTDITPERFPLRGKDARAVKARVEPFLSGESGEKAAKRLVAAGHTLANTGDLAGFLASHPKEVRKWSWIVALSVDSRWTDPGGIVGVPYANVHGAYRHFYLVNFRSEFHSGSGVLVLCE